MKIKQILTTIVFTALMLFATNATYAVGNQEETATSWEALKNIIENNDKTVVTIQLSGESSNNWNANSKISISADKNITLISNSTINIKRANNFKDSLFECSGILNIKTSSNAVKLTLDGNKTSVQADEAFISVLNRKTNYE